MKEEVAIEIPNGLKNEVEHAVRTVGVRGLDMRRAIELGAIDRISYMLCLMHSCVAVAYRVFGNVDYMLEQLNGKRHEISQACNQFEKDYERFMKFWRQQGYQNLQGVKDMNQDTEELYHQVMRWAQLPESWQLGDSQHTEADTDTFLVVELEESDLKFKRTTIKSEVVDEPEDVWCVTKLDLANNRQMTVYDNIDKASAQMSAKRLSAEDKGSLYTATILQTLTEKRIDALPMKVYMNGEVVGRVGREFRKF